MIGFFSEVTVHIQSKMKVLGSILAVFLFVAFGIFLSLPSIVVYQYGQDPGGATVQ